MRSRYARGAVEVLSWCSRGTLVVQLRYAARGVVRGALPVLPVRVPFVNFSMGNTEV